MSGEKCWRFFPPRFRDNQEGTLHFRYLLEIGGGLIRVSREFDTHLTQLSAALARPGSATHPHLAFLEAFVRPRGLSHAATPEFVRAVEDLAHCRVEPRRQGIHHALLRRVVLAGLVEMVHRPDAEAWVLGPVELERGARARTAAGAGGEVRPAKARTDDHASRLARHREEKSRRQEAPKETARVSRTHDKEARQAACAREKEARLAAKRASLAGRRQRLNAERAAAQDPDQSSS